MLIALVSIAVSAGPDPKAGYDYLLNGGYITCGVPAVIWQQLMPDQKPVFPGRRGLNASLPDAVTATRTKSGIDVVAPNCLGCHAGYLRGRPVMGLGNSAIDQTVDPTPMVATGRGFLPKGPLREEVDRWLRPMVVAGPRIQLDTVGVSSADDLAAVLMAHRDPKTLAWSAAAKLPLPETSQPVPIDVPAWWLARSKDSVFWTGSGRGSRASLMASASLLCTDSTAEARKIIAAFEDVRAYLDTLEAPKWPWPIDSALAGEGREVFARSCAGCHEKARVVSLERVGTDPLLAQRTATEAAPQLAWFNASVYGEAARLEASRGYVAQPLTGIWATAPYLHNGSVPTLAALLDSSWRPARWRRTFDSRDYDAKAVGWRYESSEQGKEGGDTSLYDTALPGYSNAGHLYGDALSGQQRRAVLEFLKTL